MAHSKIEWTNYTVNPGIFGCEQVSEACRNCYAMSIAHRALSNGYRKYKRRITKRTRHGVLWTGKVFVDPARIKPSFASLPKRTPAFCFVTSMADLFHADVPNNFIDKTFDEMAARAHISFQVLTKRAERPANWFKGYAKRRGLKTWPSNVWMGVTMENQQRYDERIGHLVRVPAPVRFLSIEPQFSQIDFGPHIHELHWVIVGGESGPGRRATEADWVRSARDQCVAAGVPFHFKQWGHIDDNPDPSDPTAKTNGGHAKGGRLLDGRTWDEFPAANAGKEAVHE